MEMTLFDYGGHLFNVMASNEIRYIKHWESIREKAEPLVRKLIRLNNEMEGGGYQIVGYTDVGGKKKLSKYERIDRSQKKLWGVKASKLKIGERVWLCNNEEHEMYINQNEDPVYVHDISKKGIYIEMLGLGGEYIITIPKNELVLKAPDDFDLKLEEYCSEKYWLEQADKLGI